MYYEVRCNTRVLSKVHLKVCQPARCAGGIPSTKSSFNVKIFLVIYLAFKCNNYLIQS